MYDGCMACSLFWLGSSLICRFYDSPLVKLEVKLADQVDPFTIAEAAEDNDFAAIVDKACRVFVDARRQRIWLVWRSACADRVPVERLQIKTIHLRLVVVLANHSASDQVHVFSCDNRLMVRDLTRYLPMRLEHLPLEPIVCRVAIFDVVQALQFEDPKVVHGSLPNVIPAEDIHPSRNQNKIIGYKSKFANEHQKHNENDMTYWSW